MTDFCAIQSQEARPFQYEKPFAFIEKFCRGPGLNRYGAFAPTDFKSVASASFATPALSGAAKRPDNSRHQPNCQAHSLAYFLPPKGFLGSFTALAHFFIVQSFWELRGNPKSGQDPFVRRLRLAGTLFSGRLERGGGLRPDLLRPALRSQSRLDGPRTGAGFGPDRLGSGWPGRLA